jgi:hypothetical protein
MSTYTRAAFDFAVWQSEGYAERIAHATRVSSLTEARAAECVREVARLLDEAHSEALEVDAEIMSTIAHTVHDTDTDTLLDILVTPGVDALVLSIVGAELQARTDADHSDDCAYCLSGVGSAHNYQSIEDDYRAENDEDGHAAAVAYAAASYPFQPDACRYCQRYRRACGRHDDIIRY